VKFSAKIEHMHTYTSGMYRHAPGICHCLGVGVVVVVDPWRWWE